MSLTASSPALAANYLLHNPLADRASVQRPVLACRDFHASLPGFAATPVREAPTAANALGVARVVVKDESNRLGLPSFKILGAAWAVCRELAERWDLGPAAELSFDDLLIAAGKNGFKLAESPGLPSAAMNAIRRYAADDAR